jgi:hypothetical protein
MENKIKGKNIVKDGMDEKRAKKGLCELRAST